MNSWLEFWNSSHSIYVCAAHKRVHYNQVVQDTLAVIPVSSKAILDWGCGEALGTTQLVSRGIQVFLYDKAKACQAQLATCFQRVSSVQVLSDVALQELRDESIDVIMMNSVVQYFSKEELVKTLLDLRRVLRQNGVLIISDVIPPGVGLFTDIWSLLKLGYRHSFLYSAILGMIRTFLSPYRTLRRSIGLNTYRDQDLLELLTACGFRGSRASKNIGCNAYRATFIAVRF